MRPAGDFFFIQLSNTRVVLVHIFHLIRNGRTECFIIHFHTAAALLIHPVQIRVCIRDFRTDLMNVCPHGFRQTFRQLFCCSAGAEIYYQYFTHLTIPPCTVYALYSDTVSLYSIYHHSDATSIRLFHGQINFEKNGKRVIIKL